MSIHKYFFFQSFYLFFFFSLINCPGKDLQDNAIEKMANDILDFSSQKVLILQR